MRYDEYEPFCDTDNQRDILSAVCEHGSARKAAKELGADDSVVRRAIRRIKNKAAKRGYAPEYGHTNTAPDGFEVRGHSTLEDKRTGETVMEWTKTSRDMERQRELMIDAVEALKDDVKRAKPRPAPKTANQDLLNFYVVTDYHLGALAWGEETGDDWDTDIAEDLLERWFGAAIQSSPKAQKAVLANMGDMLHWDGLDSVTPTSGHVLDADTRFQKLVRTAIRVFRRIVSMLLTKYPEVHVIMAEGNHDIASSVWLRELFAAHYECEPRVTVELSPDPYYCVEWGKTSVFVHHGHKKKINELDRAFAAKFRDVFGRTDFSYGHSGHLHHADMKESSLMIIEQHPTLAAKDSHASRGGYLSQRSASVITYHARFGYVGRQVLTPEMVQ
jgi:hypothetical protein